ncbi:MAG: NAD-binding protein [Streptosporangiales bacterium]|nr:NAD-binding protein [Streptosporangiales bacterium]
MGDTVGVVGLGNMGSAFATNLMHDGHAVVGYDIDEARLRAFTDGGGTPAASVGAVGERADVVITSLDSGAALLDVAAEIAATGALVMETSTLAIEVKTRAAELVEQAGGQLLDCPVSGTGSQARNRDIVVYVSGDRAAYDRLTPVLSGFTRTHRYVGEFGAGSKLKFLANLLVAVHNVAAAEALVLAKKAGVDQEMALEALTQGAGNSRMLEVRGPVMVEESWDEPSADLAIFRKDLSLIQAFAASLDCPVPVLASAAQVHFAALAQGRERQDAAAVYAVLAQAAGIPTS